ncbi:GDSL esterase/lipase [Rhynchospora pubera]|uniref:GDSL esterase/lipase n=1 Tax=Rhynchospora pubera TaxID=906938 RepID=A0AAV8ERX8_9POAL|nr:GDSL esterase/lipase [Rhynchospora pubera]KAJ4781001.1 GDSL esterase/lipase [Rhynchospora pubera]
MASRHLLLSLSIPTLILIIFSKSGNCCFTHIFCFGDSISDTGNLLKCVGNCDGVPLCHLPYGETYFHQATGRFSDGRLILDFIAEAYELPLIPAYLSGKSTKDFPHGANFAVGGAMALNNSYFESKGIEASWTDYSLGTQLQWFKKLLPSILEEPGYGSDVMNNALFVVGEIGGNDYNIPLYNGVTIEKVRTFVPDVISIISSTIHELIHRGAKILLVPNNFPIGCVPSYLTIFQSQKKEDYDPETGCIKRLNEFAQYHNAKLSEELEKLRLFYPDVTIIYADYYEASMSIFRNPKKFGIDYPLIACCGGKGPYNCSSVVFCGERGSTVCSNPSKYVSWDGIHFTEAAYKVISDGVLQGNYSSPPLSSTCSNLFSKPSCSNIM